VALAAWGLRAAGAPVSTALVLAAGFGLAGVGIMLVASRRMGVMVHCTAWCPMGAVANYLGRLNPFRVRIREGCTGSCPHGAMHYAFPGLSHERARALFTVLAVSAHAVFLGVARI